MSDVLTLPQQPLIQSNPFSTRHVRPGAIEYIFSSDENAHSLVDRFEANRLRGQIVGPHGSGKSTLLATLIPELKRQCYDVFAITLRAHQRRLPAPLPISHDTPLIIVVDGYEQLSWLSAWGLRTACARRKFGLLVTTHRACMLPMLCETKSSLAIAHEVFSQLFPTGDNRIAACDVEALYARHAGDLRETLFGLYDLYEVRRRKSSR